MLITFEGIDGVGKSTQLNLTYKWLCEVFGKDKIVKTKEPGGTERGLALLDDMKNRNLSPMQQLIAFGLDRTLHIEQILTPALSAGKIVLCDRFIDSTWAYQGYGGDVDLHIVEMFNKAYMDKAQLIIDKTLWFDLDVDTATNRLIKRGELGSIEEADYEYQEKVREGYEILYAKFPERICRIDASQSQEKIFEQVKKEIRKIK